MKSSTKTGLKIFALITLLCGAVFFCVFILPIVVTVLSWDKQMSTGRKYMDSLTEKDFQAWTDRTKKYLDEYYPKAGRIGAKSVPPELKALGIIRIDETANMVEYMWMGGLDHTGLEVERLSDNTFQFYAGYNDKEGKIIWPRKTNATLPK
jgi:hypothetical protein